MSKRQIERLVAAGQALDADTIKQLRKAPKRVSLSDLQTLAKCGEPADRKMICAALAEGKAKSAAEALRNHRSDPGADQRQAVDIEANKIRDVFRRVSQEGRKRFVRDQLKELQALIAQVSK